MRMEEYSLKQVQCFLLLQLVAVASVLESRGSIFTGDMIIA